MATSTISTAPANAVRPLIEQVAIDLVHRIYGAEGPAWGTRLTAIEDTILAVRQVLSEKMLDEALQRQANTAEKRPPEFRCRSTCGTEVVATKEPEPRIVATRAGDAEWMEPETTCRKCRRAFFPSEQELGP
ncbi:hypothetical protein [Fimbriiglobus ruber]|uniref:Uncharacterized protein n=1 Tax=Fimbriiglobus ruber TaxID=1908690 RepID=A0A225DS46_9BACT|nr:hypothetical protein [Fimbriiglobus ruber]OWK44280.1 hypothetical protein FRUB_02212 [Fimbriiglobus ruber]